jgi:hypothetical protein
MFRLFSRPTCLLTALTTIDGPHEKQALRFVGSCRHGLAPSSPPLACLGVRIVAYLVSLIAELRRHEAWFGKLGGAALSRFSLLG